MYKTDTAKLHAQERLTEYKQAVVDAIDNLLDELKQRTDEAVTSAKESLSHPDRLLDSIGTNADRLFSARTLDTIKDSIETEAAYAVGVKDQFVGGVKETLGHLLGDNDLQRKGHRQVAAGKSEVDLQKSLAEEKKRQKIRALTVSTLLHRETLLNQVVFTGGFEGRRASMRHVEMPVETQDLFASLFPRGAPAFALKRWDVQPLLKDIRERRLARPMVFVVPRERDFVRAPNQWSKKELAGMKNVTSDTRRIDLLASIRRSDVGKLRRVPYSQIRDMSEVRLELLHGLHAADESRQGVLRDIVGMHGRQQRQNLIHIAQIDDKASPEAFFEKNGFEQVHKQLAHLESMEQLKETHGADLNSRQSTAITHL